MKDSNLAVLLMLSVALLSPTDAQARDPSIEAIEGVLHQLEATAREWIQNARPTPLVAPSGLSGVEVLKRADKSKKAGSAKASFEHLLRMAPAERAQEISQRLRRSAIHEVDLWIPARLLREKRDLQARAEVLEAWIQLCAMAQRKDVLLAVAGATFELAITPVDLELLQKVSSPWFLLSQGSSGLGSAMIARAHGETLCRIGRLEESLAVLERARSLFAEIDDLHYQVRTNVLKAQCLFRTGAIDAALAAARDAQRLAASEGSAQGLGDALLEEAKIFVFFGDIARAWNLCAEALKHFAAAQSRVGEGNALLVQADLLANRGLTSSAMGLYDKAEARFKETNWPNGRASALKGKGDLLAASRSYKEALDYYDAAHGLYEETTSLHGKASTLVAEGRVEMARGRFKQAADVAEQAAALFNRRGLEADRIQALLLAAQARQALGNRDLALKAATEAIELHESRRPRAQAEGSRILVELQIATAYDITVPAIAGEPGNAWRALAEAENARSRALLDLLATVQSPGSPPAAVPSPESLRAELFKIEQQLGMESSPSVRLSLIRERARASWALQQGSYQGLPSASPLSEVELQGLIEETKSPAVVFFSAPQELWIFVLLPGSPEPIVRRAVIGRDELAKRVRGLVHDLANPFYEKRARDQQRYFWDLLIAPWLDQLPSGTRHLALIPHGALHELPFESLLDPAGTFRLNHIHVSVAPSLSALARARGRHKEPQKGDSLVALWTGHGLRPPPEEVTVALELFAKTAGVEPIKATFDSYRQSAGRASVILFATNGVHVEGSVSQTYLEIGATKGVHDSRLTAEEIVTIPLQAELVALAACDTSYGRALLSDERLDLTRSFLIAGAAAVLGARWKVPDDARTSRFLSDFFEIYRQGGPEGVPVRKDEALSEARRRSQARQDPAQVWAAWVLVGDPR